MHGVYIPTGRSTRRSPRSGRRKPDYHYYETVRRGGKTEQVPQGPLGAGRRLADHFFDDELVAGDATA